jgi:hypothetical protein
MQDSEFLGKLVITWPCLREKLMCKHSQMEKKTLTFITAVLLKYVCLSENKVILLSENIMCIFSKHNTNNHWFLLGWIVCNMFV